MAAVAKPPCQYGDRCYRTNPQHLAHFSHPRDNQKQQQPSTTRTTAHADRDADRAKRTAITAEDTAAAAGKTSKRRKAESKQSTVERRQREDGDQSDEDDDGNVDYQKLSALNLLSASDRQSYYEQLFTSLFSLSFPPDFYHFFSFLLTNHIQRDDCKRCTTSTLHPPCADAVLSLLAPPPPSSSSLPGLRCCGVYDWLAGKFDDVDRRCVKPWLHWRYFFDLPEMMTLYRAVKEKREEEEERKGGAEDEEEQQEEVKGDEGGWHCGYWRDAPEDNPPFLVSCYNFHPQCTVVGPTVYHAAHRHLLHLRNLASNSSNSSRSSASSSSALSSSAFIADIDATISRLLSHAASHQLSITQANGDPRPALRDKAYLARQRRVLSPSANTLGFVCPYDPKTEVGFRPLPITASVLTAMVDRMQQCDDEGKAVDYAEWDGVQTLLTLAMDECDPGTVLLFFEEIYCMDRVNGVRVVEGEVSQGMRRAWEMMGGREGWRRCIGMQMKYRYRKTLSQITVARRAMQKNNPNSSSHQK